METKTYFLMETEQVEELIQKSVKKAFERFLGGNQKKEDRLLTTHEACETLRISRPTLHRWKTEGIIPHVRIGASIRYKESDVMKFIEDK